jgi:hypothetical protein
MNQSEINRYKGWDYNSGTFDESDGSSVCVKFGKKSQETLIFIDITVGTSSFASFIYLFVYLLFIYGFVSYLTSLRVCKIIYLVMSEW